MEQGAWGVGHPCSAVLGELGAWGAGHSCSGMSGERSARVLRCPFSEVLSSGTAMEHGVWAAGLSGSGNGAGAPRSALVGVPGEQAEEVSGGVGVEAQRGHGDVGGGVEPVLVVVVQPRQCGVRRRRLCVHRLPCRRGTVWGWGPHMCPCPHARPRSPPGIPCILAAAMTSPAAMLETFTR